MIRIPVRLNAKVQSLPFMLRSHLFSRFIKGTLITSDIGYGGIWHRRNALRISWLEGDPRPEGPCIIFYFGRHLE